MDALDELFNSVNTSLPGLLEDVKALQETLAQNSEMLGRRLAELSTKAEDLKAAIQQPSGLCREAVKSASEGLEALAAAVEGALDGVSTTISQQGNALSTAVQNFDAAVRDAVGEMTSHVNELLEGPMEELREQFTDGISDIAENLKSDVIEPTTEGLADEVEACIAKGLDEVDTLFKDAADELSNRVKQAIHRSLDENAAMAAAIDGLKPVVGQLRPLTSSVAAIASSVGIG